jgi:nucleoside-diphosphate-sugar epimerase
MSTAVIFGGSGFIGSHYCRYLLSNELVRLVVMADLKPVCDMRFSCFLLPWIESGRIKFLSCDVRKDIGLQLGAIDDVSLVANFAAIHREPGHELHEYYETNILGARNVCRWVSSARCKQLIFTSSIAPYGAAEVPRYETSIPVPETAYGGSKLAAEEIHKAWQVNSAGNNLIIIRPGVVFGPGEGGNVSRLIKAVLHRYFFFMGNKSTRKAGVYVKELCRALTWVVERTAHNPSETTFNMTMSPAPSMEDYVDNIIKVAGIKRFIASIPFSIMYPASFLVEGFAKIIGVNQPISPVRIKKLVKSNNIVPGYLKDSGYEFKYSLESALRDWREDMPSEWE